VDTAVASPLANEQAQFSRVYRVLGVPVRVATDDTGLFEAADTVLGGWGGTEEEAVAALSLQHSPGGGGGDSAQPETICQTSPGRVEIACPVAHAIAHHRTGRGELRISRFNSPNDRDIVAARIETLAVFLAFAHRPITLHAAAVVHNHRCILMTGADGAGKSTLAYACLRDGMRLLAEDVVFAAGPSTPMTGYGNPWKLHLLPDAPRFFPELYGIPTERQLNGEEKITVHIPLAFPASAITQAEISGVLCVARSQGRESQIVRAETEEAVRSLICFKGSPPVNLSLMRRAAERLAAGPIARLQVGPDPTEAVPLIRAWADTLS
jgi:hypothetical protein